MIRAALISGHSARGADYNTVLVAELEHLCLYIRKEIKRGPLEPWRRQGWGSGDAGHYPVIGQPDMKRLRITTVCVDRNQRYFAL